MVTYDDRCTLYWERKCFCSVLFCKIDMLYSNLYFVEPNVTRNLGKLTNLGGIFFYWKHLNPGVWKYNLNYNVWGYSEGVAQNVMLAGPDFYLRALFPPKDPADWGPFYLGALKTKSPKDKGYLLNSIKASVTIGCHIIRWHCDITGWHIFCNFSYMGIRFCSNWSQMT